MRHETTMYQRIVNGARRLQAVGRRGGGVGVLAVLLLLPLMAVGQDTLETLTSPDSDEAVETLAATGPREGDLDTSFGGDGKVLTNFGSGRHDGASALVLQPDGKLVVAGTIASNADDSEVISVTDVNFGLARYLPNGALDHTFGSDGRVIADFGSSEFVFVTALAIQPDGKLVVAGESVASTDLFLARYQPDGTLDPTFGSNGMVRNDILRHICCPGFALGLQPDGKLIVAGTTASDDGDFGLARYLPNGALDRTFGSDGRVITDFGGSESVRALAIQPDGKIVVAGESYAADGSDFALARYNANGTLDTTFSSDGRVITDFGGSEHLGALAIQPDGKIVGAGTSFAADGSGDFALARYNANGTLDTTFSSDGRVITDFGNSEYDTALAIQPDGKLVVAGLQWTELDQLIILARYRRDGTLDSTFGRDGKVLTDFGAGVNYATDLVIQPRDGRLVVAGTFQASGSSDIALARYHAITCSGVVVTQVGTAGHDTIVGTPGNDVIFGFGGNDRIDGLGGDDILCGGTGNDTLRGGSGTDLLSGGPGMDRCDGGSPGSGDTAPGCEQVTGVP
jgi:uncharacterized delta-60 repeat protein